MQILLGILHCLSFVLMPVLPLLLGVIGTFGRCCTLVWLKNQLIEKFGYPALEPKDYVCTFCCWCFTIL